MKANSGRLRAIAPPTLAEAATATLEGMRDGSIRARGGGAFRAPVIREYDSMLRRRVLPHPIARKRLAHVTTADLYLLVGELHRQGLSPSSIRNTFDPIRVVFREAAKLGHVPTNPTAGLQLPTGTVKPRTCSLTPSQAVALVAALPDAADRALWATALFAGLRSGELRALRWQHVHLGTGRISVAESLSEKGELQAPKTRRGVRTVPVMPHLRDYLDALDRRSGYVFGSDDRPYTATWMQRRARRAWIAAGLRPITFHEARHACASLWIASGLDIKMISEYLGHASVTVTLDIYGHLLPTAADDATRRVGAYFEAAISDAARHEALQFDERRRAVRLVRFFR